MSEIPPYYPDWQARQEAEARGQEWAAVAEEALTAEKALRENLRAAEARVAELEAAIKEARHYLGLAKCGDPNCGGCRHDYEQAWDVLHAALKGERHG